MKIAVVTGSRADLGPLTPVYVALRADWVRVIPNPCATGYDLVQESTSCMKQALWQFEALKPDLVVLLGDRFEILAAATAAYMMQIPIAHLSGGDLTVGSMDNSIRHAITKLASLHLTTHREATNRVLAMGEEPWRVAETGCPGIDNLLSLELMPRDEVRKQIGPPIQSVIDNGYYLVAYQPATLAADQEGELNALLEALKLLGLPVVFTTVNADVGSQWLRRTLDAWCDSHHGVVVDMPPILFLSAMKHCRVMIGNSSSGLYEAPTLKIPFVNVGMRQHGRPTASSVINVPPTVNAISGGIRMAENIDCSTAVNPFGDGKAAQRIKTFIEIRGKQSRLTLLRKRWVQPWHLAKSGNGSTPDQAGDDTPMENWSGGVLSFDDPLGS